MNTELAKKEDKTAVLERVLLHGDLSKLSPQERLNHYISVCEDLGLNPKMKPFEYITLNGKMVLYALRSCTEQLRQIHKVSLNITSRETIGDVYVVSARAKTSEREDESTGAVNIKGLHGEALANAYMKAETKAKRRVTLSICGLAFLDEAEVGSIPGAKSHFTPVPQAPVAHKSPDTLPRPVEVVSNIAGEKFPWETAEAQAEINNPSQPIIQPKQVESLTSKTDAHNPGPLPQFKSGKFKGQFLTDFSEEALAEYKNGIQKRLLDVNFPDGLREDAIGIIEQVEAYLGEK